MKYFTLEVWEVLICGLLGMVIMILVKGRELQVLSRKANLQFSFKEYFVEDWLSHAASFACVLFFMVVIRRRIPSVPVNMYELLLIASGTIGYLGTTLMIKIFSSMEKRILAAVDYKTTIADTANKTLDTPTPTR